MKKATCIIIVFSLIFASTMPTFAGELDLSYFDGEIDGRQDAAQQHSSTAWGIGGFAGGFLLGLIGGGGVTLASRFVEPDISSRKLAQIQDKPSDYRLGYEESYKSEATSKNTRNALIGSGLGIVSVLIIVSATQ